MNESKKKKYQKIINVAPEKSPKINKGNPKFISDSKSSVQDCNAVIGWKICKSAELLCTVVQLYDGAMEGN